MKVRCKECRRYFEEIVMTGERRYVNMNVEEFVNALMSGNKPGKFGGYICPECMASNHVTIDEDDIR